MTTSKAKRAATKELLFRMTEKWPSLFDPENIVPLALGTYEHVKAAMPDVSASLMRKTMNRWCMSFNYLATLQAGAIRYGVNGTDGAVSNEHAEAAITRIAELQKRISENHERQLAAHQRLLEEQAKPQIEKAAKAAQPKKKTAPEPKPKQAANQPLQPQISTKPAPAVNAAAALGKPKLSLKKKP